MLRRLVLTWCVKSVQANPRPANTADVIAAHTKLLLASGQISLLSWPSASRKRLAEGISRSQATQRRGGLLRGETDKLRLKAGRLPLLRFSSCKNIHFR